MTYDPYPGGYPPNPGGQPGGYQPYPSGGPGGYQAYPGGGSMPPQQRPPAPPSVLNAVRLMYAGAVVSLISIIIGLTTIGSLKSAIRTASPTLSQSQVNDAANLSIAFVVVVGLIGVGLWIWIAQMSKAGRNWARITGTVFFGIETVLQVFSLARSSGVGSRIPAFIIWLIGLGAVILLWRKESSAFFKNQQYPGSW